MLESLSIKDFALIDSAYVDFEKGFTVLSGETGAGKSLLIGALTFLLGGKTSADVIRSCFGNFLSWTCSFFCQAAFFRGRTF